MTIVVIFIGVKGIAVHGKRADRHIIFFEGVYEVRIFLSVGQKLLGIAVCLSRVAARTDLHGVNAERGKDRKGLVQRFCAVKVGKNTQFHSNFLTLLVFVGLSKKESVFKF